MQINNKGVLIKWVVIPFSIIFCIAWAIILIVPLLISENFVKQKVIQALEGALESSCEVGQISFHWPNRISISHLTFQKQEQDRDNLIRFEDIRNTVRLLPLLTKKFDIKKISIQYINYENQYSIRNLITDKFSFRNNILFTHARLLLNDGPATLRGSIGFHEKEPVFDVFIDAEDVHITHDILHLFPFFSEKEDEIGGFLSLKGSIKGKGLGKEVFNEELHADMNLKIRDGYVRGNKIFSSLLDIAGIRDTYSFDLLEAVMQIREGKVYTPKIEMMGSLMNVNASGVAEFEGAISYDAAIMFNKDYLGKDVEKIIGLILKQNTLPVEIRGTAKDPKVSVKLPKNTLEYLIKDLVNDFLSTPKKGRRKEKIRNELD